MGRREWKHNETFRDYQKSAVHTEYRVASEKSGYLDILF